MNQPIAPNSIYLPVDQVAARFSVSIDTIWRWCRKGAFPKPYHPGGTLARWRLSEIEAFESGLTAGLIVVVDLTDSGFFTAIPGTENGY